MVLPLAFASDKDRLWFERFFSERPVSRAIFEALARYMDQLGDDVVITATKSHVAFKRSTRFLWVHTAPIDGASIGFKLNTAVAPKARRVRSYRAATHRWSHHTKLTSTKLDAELKRWLKAAYLQDVR